MGPGVAGGLAAVASIVAAVSGAYAGRSLLSVSAAWALLVAAVVLSVAPGACFLLSFRRPHWATSTLWALVSAFCFIAAVPVCAGIGRFLAASRGGRQITLVAATGLCWVIQSSVPLLLLQKGRGQPRPGRAAMRALMGVAPVLIGAVAISLAVKVVPSAPALAAAVGACGGAVVGVAMDGLYLVWASHHRQPTPPALSKAQVRLRQLTGAGFDDTIVLPSDWHEEACHIRLSPLGRSVFVVSEQIIDRLSSAELEAVIAHEMKHVIACDISAARRTTAALSFLALLALLYLGPWIDPGAGSGLAVFIAGAAGMTMARLVVELFLSRRREREADDFAAGVVGVAPVRSSLSKLSRSGPASLRTIWSTHDSVQDRLDRLREE